MATQLTLEVSTREIVGTGAVGRLRRIDDAVPGVLYGAGQETVNITLPTRVLLKAMQNENFLSQIIELKLDGHAEQVVVRDMQRHPATENITHIDFLRIREDQEIQVSVPIRFINEESCIGVRMSGGTITRNMVEVEISCSAEGSSGSHRRGYGGYRHRRRGSPFRFGLARLVSRYPHSEPARIQTATYPWLPYPSYVFRKRKSRKKRLLTNSNWMRKARKSLKATRTRRTQTRLPKNSHQFGNPDSVVGWSR